ncbi:hypothetical protein ONS95_001631 [Cadophora gregata]|uniref:uncharacterized protein n=1 Tax=Cadophora gregata TaxID=51156 RepID=UPI0026DC5192|nr:uncharacterized protein ONS95_001631 [Cadophora gregata]KAK0111259.1 hypothetical protein ONS95_001631 [Cadophora gregata]KAK0112268.1 hypothetical protein ONS96_001517 [Cadophora gregata f. sp. sojae]
MKVSPLRTEFFAQSSIDKDNMADVPRESCGWLLSSPFTAIVSRMHLSSPLRSQPLSAYDEMAQYYVDSRSDGFQASSEDFPDHCSLSLYSSGESDSWVMEDMFESSQFNPSYNRNHSSFGSSLSQLEDEEQIWRMWDANEDSVSSEPLLCVSEPVKVRDQEQHGTTRKLPSQIQSDILQSRKVHQLQRSSATRSPRRTTRARVDPTSPVAKTTYSAFPPETQSVPKVQRGYHGKCASFPAPTEPRMRPQRSRANTTPAPCPPSLHQDIFTSDLNSSATSSHKSQDSSTYLEMPLFMHSAPVSPQYPPPPERDLMDLMVETSRFSDDEDDEDEDQEDGPGFVVAMKSVLNLRRSNSSTDIEKLAVEKARVKPSRRNLSDTLNSWFKKKNRATL